MKKQTLITITLMSLAGFLALTPEKYQAKIQPDSGTILRHIAFLDFNEEAVDSVITSLGRDINALEITIPQIRRIEWGVNLIEDAPYTHGLMVSFESREDLNQYLEHPDHRAIVEKYGRYIEKVTEVDYWTEE